MVRPCDIPIQDARYPPQYRTTQHSPAMSRPPKIKVLTASAVVAANPLRYWGMASPTPAHVNSEISSQLMLEGCEPQRIEEHFGWQIIAFPIQCYRADAIDSERLRQRFLNAKGFPP